MKVNDHIQFQKTGFQIDFTHEQLWYLLNISAPNWVIGVENPYNGKFIDEVQISEQRALNGLISKDFVHYTQDEVLEIKDASVKSMIETCLKSDRCLWLTVSQGGTTKVVSQCWVYFSGNQIVDITREGDQEYQLTSFQDTTALTNTLDEFLTPNEKGMAAGSEFDIEQTVFDAVISCCNSGDFPGGKKALLSADLKDTAVEELMDALGENGLTMIAVHISNPSQPEKAHFQGMGYISGRLGGWLIKQYEQDGTAFMHFHPGLAQEFRDLTFSMVE